MSSSTSAESNTALIFDPEGPVNAPRAETVHSTLHTSSLQMNENATRMEIRATSEQSACTYFPSPSLNHEHGNLASENVVLQLQIDAVEDKVSAQGDPFAEVLAERRLWLAGADDFSRNGSEAREENEDRTCVCSICLDDIQLHGSDEQV